MIRQPISRKRTIALGMLSVAMLVGGYWYLSYRQHQKNPDDKTVPTFTQLYQGVIKAIEMDDLDQERWIVVDGKATLKRLTLGLAIGWFLGLLMGTLMGVNDSLRAFFFPPNILSTKMIPTAMMAIFIIMVGVKLKLYVTVIAFGITAAFALALSEALRDVKKEQQHTAESLGATDAEVVVSFMLPLVLPQIINLIRWSIGPALIFLVAMEYTFANEGFGFRLRVCPRLFTYNVMYVYVAIIAAAGFLADLSLQGLMRWWCPWHLGKRRSS